MTVRETSADAFRFIRVFLPASHLMIMDVFYSVPDKEDGWTMRELRQYIIDEGIMPPDKCLSSSMSARLNEMVKAGWIVEDGKRECEISGRTTIIRKLSYASIIKTAFYWGHGGSKRKSVTEWLE